MDKSNKSNKSNKVQFNKVLKELIQKSKNNCLIKDELCLMITCNRNVCFC